MRTASRIFEEYLVTLAQGGDRAALEQLARRWRPRHYAHARRLLCRDDLAADAVQEAWLGIVRALGRLHDPARFDAWSYAIVTRRCRDQQRRAVRSRAEPLSDGLTDPHAADIAQHMDLRRALSALSPDQCAALALFYLNGFTAAEIAEALCIPIGTVKTRLFHARRALRRSIEGEQT